MASGERLGHTCRPSSLAILQFLFLDDGSYASSLAVTDDVGGEEAGAVENPLMKKPR